MIPLFRVHMSAAAHQRVSDVLSSGYIGQGKVNAEFEDRLSNFVGAQVLTVNSCTAALDLALHLIGVGPGDAVISTPMTCTATNGVIVNRGARIVWADVDPVTGLIDPADVKRKMSASVKAVMAVDWGGQSCEYEALREVADGVPIVQDAAHNVMADPDNGGDYIAWSFQAIKHLTSGDGGALRVPFYEYQRARLLRWYGLDRDSSDSFRCEQSITEAGYKYHMNDINSAIGLANLADVDEVVEAHRFNAYSLRSALADAEDVIGLPPQSDDSSWWLFTVRVSQPKAFIDYMAEAGVMCSPVHKRNDVHPAFRRVAISSDLPGVDAFAEHEVAIPVGWWLSKDDRSHIVRSVLSYARSVRGNTSELSYATEAAQAT